MTLPCETLPVDWFFPPRGRSAVEVASTAQLTCLDVCDRTHACLVEQMTWEMDQASAAGIWGGVRPRPRDAMLKRISDGELSVDDAAVELIAAAGSSRSVMLARRRHRDEALDSLRARMASLQDDDTTENLRER